MNNLEITDDSSGANIEPKYIIEQMKDQNLEPMNANLTKSHSNELSETNDKEITQVRVLFSKTPSEIIPISQKYIWKDTKGNIDEIKNQRKGSKGTERKDFVENNLWLRTPDMCAKPNTRNMISDKKDMKEDFFFFKIDKEFIDLPKIHLIEERTEHQIMYEKAKKEGDDERTNIITEMDESQDDLRPSVSKMLTQLTLGQKERKLMLLVVAVLVILVLVALFKWQVLFWPHKVVLGFFTPEPTTWMRLKALFVAAPKLGLMAKSLAWLATATYWSTAVACLAFLFPKE